MRRRQFITLLGGAAAGWPLAARGQQASMPVIGILSPGHSGTYASPAFDQGLSQAGFVEKQSVSIEYRWADDQNDRLPELAADLVRRMVRVIVTFGNAAANAAKAATTTIPIVFQGGFDPVAIGLVASLMRPGGNLTGVTTLGRELLPKRLEVLHELLPAITNISLLVNPTSPGAEPQSRSMEAAVAALGLQLNVLNASSEGDFDSVFATLLRLRPTALVIGPDPFLITRSEQIGALTLRHAVPAVFQFPDFTAAGGLMSYGSSLAESIRLAGVYAGRILKGENPADLPVQQAAKVELIINLKTAKALGITVPITLLGRADEVIE
jgi:putative ABC transport system substrate-binding protein